MNLTRFATLGRSLALVATLGVAAAAQATPITYTFTGLASGSFTATGGVAQNFAGEALTVTINTDTTNIDTTRFGPGIWATHDLVSGTISVATLGTGNFNNPLYVFNNQGTETVGFGDLAHEDLVSVRNLSAGLDTYDLTSDFGPVVGTPPNLVFQFSNVALSIGTLTLTSLANATFTADARNAVPEPQTLALVAAALTLLSATQARRRAKAQ